MGFLRPDLSNQPPQHQQGTKKSKTEVKNIMRQLYRYILIGSIAFVIDAGLLLLLIELGIHYIIANSLSFTIANAFNFIVGHYFVFSKTTRFNNLFQSYVAVLGISLFGLLLNDVILFIGVDIIRLDVMPAKILATIIVLLWNFGARKRLVYTL
jgi:putative flippase GtrA